MAAHESHRLIDVGPVRLHCVEQGAGDPVILLHGFPEFWYAWRHQLPALADAGFRAIAPDLRGYNRSDQPHGIAAYRMKALVDDVAGLIRHTGRPCHLVGHDWGGVIAWRLAALRPDLVRRLVVLNAPHPALFREHLASSPAQRRRSAYTLYFQLPWFPEWRLGRRDFAALDRMFRAEPIHPGAYTRDDLARYKQAYRRAGGLTGSLNYYRAAWRFRHDLYGPPHRVLQPTLVVWGEQDRYLGTELTEGLERWVRRLQVVRIPDASHWVHNDVPDRVNRALIDFFND